MLLSRTRCVTLCLALPLLWPAVAFAQAPATATPKVGAVPHAHSPAVAVAAPAAGYHWRTLVLQHAIPSDILQLTHWSASPAHPATLPAGVLRIFALRSTNSLLLEATDDGYAKVVKIVNRWDNPPRSVQVAMVLIAVPETHGGLYTPDIPASRLLPLLLANGGRRVFGAMITMTGGETATFSTAYSSPLTDLPQLVQANGGGVAAPVEMQIMPRINADGTGTVGLTFAPVTPSLSAEAPMFCTVRVGDSAVYEVTGPLGARGERVFFFLRTVIIGDSTVISPNDRDTVAP